MTKVTDSEKADLYLIFLSLRQIIEMESIKYILTTNWHPMRWIALSLGLFFGIQSIINGDGIMGFLGVFFLYQAITNSGCFGSRGCEPAYQKVKSPDKQEIEDIEFTEIK